VSTLIENITKNGGFPGLLVHGRPPVCLGFRGI